MVTVYIGPPSRCGLMSSPMAMRVRVVLLVVIFGAVDALRVSHLRHPHLPAVTSRHAPHRISVAMADDAAMADDSPPAKNGLQGLGQRVRGYFSVKMDKKSLAALGGAMLLSYGFVSNASYMVSMVRTVHGGDPVLRRHHIACAHRSAYL